MCLASAVRHTIISADAKTLLASTFNSTLEARNESNTDAERKENGGKARTRDAVELNPLKLLKLLKFAESGDSAEVVESAESRVGGWRPSLKLLNLLNLLNHELEGGGLR